MNNKHIIMGVAALAIGTAFTSCSHDFEYDSPAQAVTDSYNRIFIETFGEPAANHTWGFGSAATAAARGVTRAVFSETWPGRHDEGDSECLLDESKFAFTVPSTAVDLTKGSFTDAEKSATEFYIPSTFNGELNFNHAFNIPAGAKIYNLGTVTALNSMNHDGVTTFYNVGTMTYTISSGSRHTVINTNILTVKNFANIGDVYNKGTLTLDNWGYKADIPNDMHIYSNGEGGVIIPNGADFKAVCDIHGTITVLTGDLKIQNSTRKYVCGIDVQNGNLENVDGPLETSYVHANVFKFDGNPIYLLPGGHVDVTTLQVPNSGSLFYGAAGSTGLVEAVNYEFGNKNDFTHTFSNNIYFKVSGYVKVDNCYAMGQSHYFDNVADYLADATHADEFDLAKDRINSGDAKGSPACGEAWSIGTPDPTTPGDDDDDDEVWDEWVRIIAEDLSVTQRTDFDFNDVVFDARLNSTKTKAQILLKAAGGTLPLTVGWSGEPGTSYSEFEVHNMYNVSTNVMVNTNAKNGVDGLGDVSKTLTGDFREGYNAIKIMVQKLGEWIEIKATQGEPAGKIQVTTDYNWCDEREDISKKYEKFTEYVEKGDNVKWY